MLVVELDRNGSADTPTHGLPVSPGFTRWLGTWAVFLGDKI
jgi:hypothetical protein